MTSWALKKFQYGYHGKNGKVSGQTERTYWEYYSNIRVGPNYEKLPDQAPNWSKVVPWYKEQYETLITQLS